MRKRWVLAGGATLAALTSYGFQSAQPREDVLAQARNLGKAFYENPTTQAQSVDQFKKALDMEPNSARERVNYGISLLHNAKTAEGIAELEKAQKQDPSIPHTWFNLAIAYKKDSQFDKAIAQFQGMVKLVPDEPISHYNLGYLYKLTEHPAEALREYGLMKLKLRALQKLVFENDIMRRLLRMIPGMNELVLLGKQAPQHLTGSCPHQEGQAR